MDNIRVCLLKILPEKGNLSGNFERLCSILQRVSDPDVDVFITSEGYLDGYVVTEEGVTKENITDYGVKEEHLNQISEFSLKRNAWFVLGCIQSTDEGGKNAAFIFNRKGKIVDRYYKVHCDRKYVPGSELPVFESDFGKFGVMICADRRWPEVVRTLALKGARIIFNPTFGFRGSKNEYMMRTRSYESEIYICFTHARESLITNPSGDVEARLISNVDGFLIHDIDLKVVDASRDREDAHLRNLRPEVYVSKSNIGPQRRSLQI